MEIDGLKTKVDKIVELLTVLDSLLDTLRGDKQVLERDTGLEPSLLDDLEDGLCDVEESISYMTFQIKG